MWLSEQVPLIPTTSIHWSLAARHHRVFPLCHRLYESWVFDWRDKVHSRCRRCWLVHHSSTWLHPHQSRVQSQSRICRGVEGIEFHHAASMSGNAVEKSVVFHPQNQTIVLWGKTLPWFGNECANVCEWCTSTNRSCSIVNSRFSLACNLKLFENNCIDFPFWWGHESNNISPSFKPDQRNRNINQIGGGGNTFNFIALHL